MKQHVKVAAVVAAVGMALVGCTTAGQAPTTSGSAAPGETEAAEVQSLGRIEIIAPANPGSGWDQTARAFGTALESAELAESITVTNVPGASGTVALAQVASNPGREGVLMASGLAMMSGVLTNETGVSLDDITPIARLIGEAEVIVVPEASEIQSIEDLMAAIAEDPGAVPIAGGSAGSADHVFLGLLAEAYEIEPSSLNYVPFSGGGEATTALLGNQVSAGIAGIGEFRDQILEGTLRPLLISSTEPVEGIEVQNVEDIGHPDLEFANWRSIMAPGGIDDELREQYVQVVTEVVESDAWAEQLETNDWADLFLAGDEFDAWLDEENTRVEGVLSQLGLVVQ
ncbi:tripartite tricarboxylate transporter substrate binding protein [Agrococcus sp. HG114]|uniref:Bug family tripartite tricarboxylate transporter substrate binding protein n=1 Tax=Agrococcus sp. HG114 TaxID=2969757 RepID=UPI00215B35C6|nr:tripartite tricarboxylate transporter substrate binding protein [Agrococcus sp. HG114]MCR8671487.1 tripartite tricarboxylate transporter substrate binding protein [Agrococcus sp. HG114]